MIKLLTMTFLTSILLTSTVFASIPFAFGSSNLVSNGSFEEPAGGCDGAAEFLSNGSTEIAGWGVSGLGVDWICTLWPASDGDYSVDLNAFHAGSVLQPTSLDVGATYELSFDMAGNPTCGDTIKVMTVFANNGAVKDEYTFDTTGKSLFDMGYVTHTLSFTAIVEDSQLIFASGTLGACGPVIDNVILTETAPAVTEVSIDVKPGSDPSSVNCKNEKGAVPLAVFGSEDFDASAIDLSNLELNGVQVTEVHDKIHLEDVNNDGIDDAVLHLDKAGVCEATQDASLRQSVDVTLTGSTTDSQDFEGTGDIRIVNR